MTFEERDQVDAERTDAIRETVSACPRGPVTDARSPPTVKIIDRLKTSLRRDRRSTGHPIEGVADPASAERDRAGNEQNRDDERPAVSTAHETPEPEPATESATEPATDPVTEPATESATESATDPAIESATEPAAEPATEPTTAPAACPRCGATGEAPCTTPSGKATKAHKGREQ